jgi:hypothetical protein
MDDGRRRRRAKRERRDARRNKVSNKHGATELPLIKEVRRALARGRPLELLGLASGLIHLATPDRWAYLRAQKRDPFPLDALIATYIGAEIRETTAMLAVFAELLPDDADGKARCRREVASRTHALPVCLSRLSDIRVHRAVRRSHVLGDRDELWLEAELADGHALTCAVLLDHNYLSEVADVFVSMKPIDDVIPRDDVEDFSDAEMNLADARACITYGFERVVVPDDSDSSSGCRPLLQWLISHLPEGGETQNRRFWNWQEADAAIEEFFASHVGQRFSDPDYRELLNELLDSGTGDPLRWSAARVRQALAGPSYNDGDVPLEIVVNAPQLLRAYVPFAHARSGIREGFTADALAAIDESAPAYHQEVVELARESAA